jgi:hypothetical protein
LKKFAIFLLFLLGTQLLGCVPRSPVRSEQNESSSDYGLSEIYPTDELEINSVLVEEKNVKMELYPLISS